MDKGHENLINDLRDLLLEAEVFNFHDFKNDKYATPKIELYNKLNEIIHRMKDGNYDN